MHAYTYIYAHTHVCTPCSECVTDVYVDVKTLFCITYIPTHALVPRAPIPKCIQHSLQKKFIYTYIHTYAYACICTRTHLRIHDTAQHAEAPLVRLTIYAQICIRHTHIRHVHMHASTPETVARQRLRKKPDLTPVQTCLVGFHSFRHAPRFLEVLES